MDAFIGVNAVSNVFTIPLDNKSSVNVAMPVIDTVTKTIVLTRVAMRNELFLELTYELAAAITWWSGIVWRNGSAPVLTAGKTYRMVFLTSNGGGRWHGNFGGGM